MRPLSLLKMCDFLWGATGNLEERYPLKLCKYVVMATCLHFPEVLEQNFWHLLYLKQKDTPTRSLQDILSLSLSLSPPLLSHTHAHARTDAPAHMGAHHVMMILRTLELWRRGVGQSFLVFPPPGGYVCITVFVFFVLFLAPSPSPLCGSSNNCTF